MTIQMIQISRRKDTFCCCCAMLQQSKSLVCVCRPTFFPLGPIMSDSGLTSVTKVKMMFCSVCEGVFSHSSFPD